MSSSTPNSHSDSRAAPGTPAFNAIVLIGQNSFFNRLLRDFLSDHLMLAVEIKSFETCQPDPEALLLINLQDFQYKILENHLSQLQQHHASCQVAVLNLDSTCNTDGLLNWPVVKGLLHGQATDQLLLKGLQAIQQGDFWFSRRELNILARQRTAPPASKQPACTLTNREQQILQLLKDGLSNEEIAGQLFLSKHTIKTHLYNLYRKLGIKNRTQALKYYQQLN